MSGAAAAMMPASVSITRPPVASAASDRVRRERQPPARRTHRTSTPWITPASDESIDRRSDSWVLPTWMAAKNKAMGAIQTTRKLASSTTRTARNP